ncbi:MAG: serine/threonine protein kinase [Deltaproteobacteria bacterium]|nr:serine/threonine protein kinase [Deltaproteobacteria bacterium]
MDDLVGTTLGDRYRITRRLGSGGVAELYEATHAQIGQRFAVKVLKPEFLGHAELAQRFLTEARAASAVGHPGIVQVIDFGHLRTGEPYLVMELLQGEDLKQLLERKKRLTEPEAITITLHVLEALAAAHRAGVLHRDLKPENVVLVRGPEGRPWAKVIDFGIARVTSRDPAARRVTRHGTVMGTPAFMAPEQARGSVHVDARSDLYSVGVMLFEMTTGQLPFRGASPTEVMVRLLQDDFPRPRQVCPDVSSEMEQVILRATAKKPDNRYPSAAEFVAALRGLRARYEGGRAWRDEDAPQVAETTGIRRLHELVDAEFEATAEGPAAGAPSASRPPPTPRGTPPPPPRRPTPPAPPRRATPPPPEPAAGRSPAGSTTIVVSRRAFVLAMTIVGLVFAAALVVLVLLLARGG